MIGGRLCRSIQLTGCIHVSSCHGMISRSPFHQRITTGQCQEASTSQLSVIKKQNFLAHKRLISTGKRLFANENPITWFDRAVVLSEQKVNALKEVDANFKESITEKRDRNKRSFCFVVDKYLEKESVYRRGHVEFVMAGLDKMKEMDLHRDLDCYKMLLQCFPQGVMIPQTVWQVEFMHFPKQQECCIEIIEQMERYGVIGDQEFGEMLMMISGDKSHSFRKFRRHLYWTRKFSNLNPFPVPREMPDDDLQLALLALKKISVDLENEITVWKTSQVEENALEDTFIASAQSPDQRGLLKKHKTDVPLYVEGGYTVYMKYKSVTYFVLRADADPNKFIPVDPAVEEDYLMDFPNPYDMDEENREVVERPSEHEQEDGTIFATCVTGTSSKDSLITWIRYLQKKNPMLEHAKIVFTLKSAGIGGDDVSTPLIEQEKKLIEDGKEKQKQKL